MSENLAPHPRRRYVRDEYLPTPAWAHNLPTQVKSYLQVAYMVGDLPDLEKDTIRATGPMYWMRFEGFGRKRLAELACAIGGWTTDRTDLEKILQSIKQIKREVAEIEAVLTGMVQ
jgi:hypothetical protein